MRVPSLPREAPKLSALTDCQGMNNLTATLLLTYPAEEDAFWVLCCIVERILPSDYYTSQLLVSQADQRVLRDLVEEHAPKVAAHLDDLGVELPAVTFGWFLSLFTDSLPIQTLLCVLSATAQYNEADQRHAVAYGTCSLSLAPSCSSASQWPSSRCTAPRYSRQTRRLRSTRSCAA